MHARMHTRICIDVYVCVQIDTHTHAPMNACMHANRLIMQARMHNRTNYTCRHKTSCVASHAQRVSLAVVKGEGEIVATAVLHERTDQLCCVT